MHKPRLGDTLGDRHRSLPSLRSVQNTQVDSRIDTRRNWCIGQSHVPCCVLQQVYPLDGIL
eukprot:COSAG02_NODE_61073_length_269_cov_1.164706_1_plen_60_part_01